MKKMKYFFGRLFQANQEFLFEAVFITKQGQKITAECYYNSMRENGKVFGICVARDISERKAVEEIKRGSGTQFDPYLAEIFIEIITNQID